MATDLPDFLDSTRVAEYAWRERRQAIDLAIIAHEFDMLAGLRSGKSATSCYNGSLEEREERRLPLEETVYAIDLAKR